MPLPHACQCRCLPARPPAFLPACSAGADPSRLDFDGKTPLHNALEMQASPDTDLQPRTGCAQAELLCAAPPWPERALLAMWRAALRKAVQCALCCDVLCCAG